MGLLIGELARVTELVSSGLAGRGGQEVTMEERRRGSLAGIDVHKKMLVAVVRKDSEGATEYEWRKFGATQQEIRHLAAWLQSQQVSDVAMESTAQYWRPVWMGLEDHFRLLLAHPLLTRAARGRKSDLRDAKRLADRLWAGDLVSSFIPDREQREWRQLTRMRLRWRRKIVLVRGQMEGVLEEGGIKLSSVVSDVFGATGTAILEQLARGVTDPVQLAEQARGQIRKYKMEQLREALEGRVGSALQLAIRHLLEQMKLLERQIAEINAALAVAMKGQAVVIHRLCQVPGIDVEAAQELLAEIGPAAARFDSPEQLASWIGVCPGQQESAGINYSRRSAKGNAYLRRLLTQIAWAASRTKRTFFATLHRRLARKMGSKGATWAIANRIAKLVWKLLHERVDYVERGEAPMSVERLRRKCRRLLSMLQQAGVDPKELLLVPGLASVQANRV